MLIVEVIVAVALCLVITLASYLVALYVEALKLRPRPSARSFEHFDEHVLPLLKLKEPEGIRRYSMLRQLSLVLLAGDLTLLMNQGQTIELALLEAVVIAVAAMALFAHVVPSILVTRTRGRWAERMAPLARFLIILIHPLVILTGFANSVVELGGEPEQERSATPAEEIEALLDAGQEEGLIGEDDRKLIQAVVEFGDKTVREVMTARPEIVAIASEDSVEALRSLQLNEEYSRIPVYKGSVDGIVDYVNSRDTLEVSEEQRTKISAGELARPLSLVPETKPINELMRELQDSNAQMAVVVDEYGQTAGIVTMEDMMEEIVGEIRDETEPGRDIVEYPDKSFVSSGNLDLDRLYELVSYRPDGETESTTVGGLVCEYLGQVPDPGAKLKIDGIEIEVLSADDRRVRTVRVRRSLQEA